MISLPAFTVLDIRHYNRVTAAGVQALRNTTAAPTLRIEWEPRSFFEVVADEDEDDSEDHEDFE